MRSWRDRCCAGAMSQSYQGPIVHADRVSLFAVVAQAAEASRRALHERRKAREKQLLYDDGDAEVVLPPVDVVTTKFCRAPVSWNGFHIFLSQCACRTRQGSVSIEPRNVSAIVSHAWQCVGHWAGPNAHREAAIARDDPDSACIPRVRRCGLNPSLCAICQIFHARSSARAVSTT